MNGFTKGSNSSAVKWNSRISAPRYRNTNERMHKETVRWELDHNKDREANEMGSKINEKVCRYFYQLGQKDMLSQIEAAREGFLDTAADNSKWKYELEWRSFSKKYRTMNPKSFEYYLDQKDQQYGLFFEEQ